MKTKNIILGIVSVLITSVAMAGNDPQASSANYKHPNKAAKAKAIENEAAQHEQTVVVKTTVGSTSYKNNFQKADYTTEKVAGNQGSAGADNEYNAKRHNYKSQF